MHLIAAIVLAGIILYYLRTTVVALNGAERLHRVRAGVAITCNTILERY